MNDRGRCIYIFFGLHLVDFSHLYFAQTRHPEKDTDLYDLKTILHSYLHLWRLEWRGVLGKRIKVCSSITYIFTYNAYSSFFTIKSPLSSWPLSFFLVHPFTSAITSEYSCIFLKMPWLWEIYINKFFVCLILPSVSPKNLI